MKMFPISRFSRGLWTPDAMEPTFAEFVHYLINTDIADYDEHWLPVSLRCRYVRLEIIMQWSLLYFTFF